MYKSKKEFQRGLNVGTIIENLENGRYLMPELNHILKDEVKWKIKEFSHWFDTARLYFLKCDPVESEIYTYLLQHLAENLTAAVSDLNKSANHGHQSYVCNVCDEQIEVQPWQNVWSKLQDHPHFEECYSNLDKTPNIVAEFQQSDESSVEDLSDSELEPSDKSDIVIESSTSDSEEENVSGLEFIEESPNTSAFKVNFEVTYDKRIEKTLYPETLVVAAHKADHLPIYTIRQHDIDQGVCLLCPCTIMAKGKNSKLTPYVIKNHAFGHNHLKCASRVANTSALMKYHEFWQVREPIYQAHQVYFIPEITDGHLCKCRLCQQSVPYDDVIEHIKTDKLHKTTVWKIFKSPKRKLNDFSLFDMQVEMYDDLKREKKEKNLKNKVLAQRKCVFIKFVIKPNQVNLLPRYRDHSQFLTKNADLISCRICKTSFCNSSTVIKKHILSAQHTQLSQIPPQKYTFYCDICKTQLSDEDAWDDHFVKGPNNHASVPQKRKLKVAERECSTCKFVIYGDQLSLNNHISSRWSKNDKTKEMKSSRVQKRGNLGCGEDVEIINWMNNFDGMEGINKFKIDLQSSIRASILRNDRFFTLLLKK